MKDGKTPAGDARMNLRPLKIPPVALLVVVLGLAAGELACGTSIYFASMMAIVLLCIGITYNMLGGVATLGGIVFTAMALRWVVISQFAKVLLRQPADSHMAVPSLTVTVYAVFFLCALAGVFLFGHLRFQLPKPFEPETATQSAVLYAIALPLGLAGAIAFNVTNVVYSNGVDVNTQYNSYRSMGVALQVMLSFALVLAVDGRIRRTEGRHSFGIWVLVPLTAIALDGFFNTVRGGILESILLYFITCYFRGYRFRTRHYVVAICSIIVFSAFISPLELYSRGEVSGMGFEARVYEVFYILRNANWPEIRAATEETNLSSEQYEDYYGLPGTSVLSRVSRIRMDSNLIAACEHFHYGFSAIRADFLVQVPRFIDPNKPNYGSGDFLGRVAGVSADVVGNTEPAFTMVSDSFGAFGWMGVCLTALVLVPLVFRIYESMFNMGQPWGTVALLLCITGTGEGGLGQVLAVALIRIPVYLVVISYVVGMLTRLVPASGDRALEPLRVPQRSGLKITTDGSTS